MTVSPFPDALRTEFISVLYETQRSFTEALESYESTQTFVTTPWEREEDGHDYGGGGVSMLLRNGAVFEQAGVNVSVVKGTLPEPLSRRLLDNNEFRGRALFTACGVSLVIHPRSPKIPTTHANFRLLTVENRWWFGGGADLTPYEVNEEDFSHFHAVLRRTCDIHDTNAYLKYKKWCDEYFYLPHRGETRGIGGIFFDYLGRGEDIEKAPDYYRFVESHCYALPSLYLPIVDRNKDKTFTDKEKAFQLLRRGRYVEFNLLYDKGTQFGLATGGRTESILMSLPPLVTWDPHEKEYYSPNEAALLEILRTPRSWSASSSFA
jgi:coproporphyrinogen III oxidase